MKTETIVLLAVLGVAGYLLYAKYGTTMVSASDSNAAGWALYSKLLGQGVDPRGAEAQVRQSYPSWTSMSA